MKEKKKSLEKFASVARHLAVLTIALIDFISAYKSFRGGNEEDDE